MGPMDWYEQASDGQFKVLAKYSGTATLVSPSAAPEPAAWALMLLGFGGLGAVLRRRRAAALA